MRLRFLGATGTVTGSKYLLTGGERRLLVDCGLFQGFKQLRSRNWQPFPVDPRSLDAVILSHAEPEHCGYLPRLVREGFEGKVYCSAATRALCEILLPEIGRLQQEEAEYANRKGFTRHSPALPLYSEQDAVRALNRLTPLPFDNDMALGPDLSLRLLPAGHMPGAAMVRVAGDGQSVLFTGTLGRPGDLLMRPPAQVEAADYLIVQSTYGNRLHDRTDPRVALAWVLERTFRRGGIVVVPAFAVGRVQALMYLIHLLKAEGRIADVPVFIDGPMAADATRVLIEHRDEHHLAPPLCKQMCAATKVITSAEESKQVNERDGPMIVVAGDGMATGGRVVHYLKTFAPEAPNTILFLGFQGGGTRGAAMVAGAGAVKIHGKYVPVRAEVILMDSLCGEADCSEILAWLQAFRAPPRRVFVTHGEPDAADALRRRIAETLSWNAALPDYAEEVVLE